jgi:hypothetical protein
VNRTTRALKLSLVVMSDKIPFKTLFFASLIALGVTCQPWGATGWAQPADYDQSATDGANGQGGDGGNGGAGGSAGYYELDAPPNTTHAHGPGPTTGQHGEAG